MTGGGESTAGKSQLPKFGKDHLTLADWRTGVLRFQQPRDNHGSLPATLTTGFQRPDGPLQDVLLERGAASEFPTVADEDVILGLIYLASDQGFPDVVRFMPSRLVEIIRWPTKQQSYQRVRRALERYKKLTATFTGNWYDRATRRVLSTLVTGVVAQAEVVTAKGRRSVGQVPRSHVQWTENFATSLREGNLIDIDLELLFSWRRPGTKVLHRHLNKVWHGGRKPRVYERDLKELACGHLGMKDGKDLKRNFQNLVREMEQRGYLTPLPIRDRFEKKGVGIWRVRLELHPDQIRPNKRRAQVQDPGTPGDDDVRLIVQTYHRFRFDHQGYEPKPHELQKAASLLRAHGLDPVLKVTRSVAEKVRSQSKDDLYFGFAVPYYEKAVGQAKSLAGFRDNLHDSDAIAQSSERRLAGVRASRNDRRGELLRRWSSLDDHEKQRLLQKAMQRVTSEAVRRRLASCDLSDPPIHVLAEVEHSPPLRVGEC